MTRTTAAPSLLGKLGWLALGTLLTFGLFEGGFRVLEGFLDRSDPGEAAEYTVLAEGDSFTYGIGGLSFPQQLETVLNEVVGYRQFRAINEGVPGLNSAMVAARLEDHLREHRPDVVIVLIGENNSWNSIRVEGVGDEGLLTRLDGLLLHSRVYKFFRVWSAGWSAGTFHEAAQAAGAASRHPTMVGDEAEQSGLPFPTGEPHLDKRIVPDLPPEGIETFKALIDLNMSGRYEECVAAAEAFHVAWPDEPQGYVTKAAALRRLNRLDEAEQALLKAESLADGELLEEIYFSLGSTRHRAGDLMGARAAWVEGLRHFPESEAIYWSVARAYHDLGETFGALSVEEEVPEVARNPMHQYLETMSSELGGGEGADLRRRVSEEFRKDLRRMIELARVYDAKILFSSYPDVVYADVEAVAREEGVPHVDFRPWFASRFTSRDEYISSDRCHCNTAGYRLMAEVFSHHVRHLLGMAPGVPDPPEVTSTRAIDDE